MPSWEEIVNQVVVASNYYGISDASTKWSGVFRHMQSLRDAVQTLSEETESWKGDAADAFRKHLKTVMNDLEDLHSDHSKIVQGLDGAANHLETAVHAIPIPSWMIDKVKDNQQKYASGMSVMGFGADSFATEFVAQGGSLASHIPGFKSFSGWANDHEKDAQNAYNQLDQDYSGDVQDVPQGKQTPTHSQHDADDYGGPDGTGGTGSGSAPSPGTGGVPDPTDPGTGPGPHGPHAGDGSDLGGSNDPYGSDPYDSYDPDSSGLDDPGAGSGLAGAGGGPTGAGTGAGGLGSGGGLGSSGGPKAVNGLGPAVSPFDGAPKGAGGAAGQGGMMGRGMRGGGGGGQGDEHQTWLTEDEDPWGGDSDAAPSVLS